MARDSISNGLICRSKEANTAALPLCTLEEGQQLLIVRKQSCVELDYARYGAFESCLSVPEDPGSSQHPTRLGPERSDHTLMQSVGFDQGSVQVDGERGMRTA